MAFAKRFCLCFMALLLVACGGGGGGGGSSGGGGGENKKAEDIHLEFLVGETMSLKMEGRGTSWEWYHDGKRLSGNVRTQPTIFSLTVKNLALSDSGAYWAVYLDGGKKHTTNKAFVSIKDVPVVLGALPASREVVLGETVTLAASVQQGTGLSYQWYKGATVMTGEQGKTLALEIADDTDIASYSVRVSNSVSEEHSSEIQLIQVDQYATGYWWGKKGDTVYSDIIVEPSGDFWMALQDYRETAPYILFQRGRITTENGSWALEPGGQQSSLLNLNSVDVIFDEITIADALIEQKSSLQATFAYADEVQSLKHAYQANMVEQQIALNELAGIWENGDLRLDIGLDGTLWMSSFFLSEDCELAGSVVAVADSEYLFRLNAEISDSGGCSNFADDKIEGVGTLTPYESGPELTFIYGISAENGDLKFGLIGDLVRQ